MTSTLHVSDDPHRMLAERLAGELAACPFANVAVSGGRTPKRLFQLLSTDYRDRIDWSRTTLYQVDERPVPPAHEDSNWRLLQENLLDQVPGIRAFRMEAERPDGEEDYDRLLHEQLPPGPGGIPVFDIVLLGMGPDGHTASLFPGTAALNETRRAVVRNAVPQLITERVTLALPCINAARLRWFLVCGADRARVVAEARRGEHPAGKVLDPEWFVDPAAAAG
jgi:6-phosphogluconolactonase